MFKRFLAIILLIALGTFFCLSAAYAAEQENKAARFFKNLVKWPFNIGKRGVEATKDTAEKSVETVAETTSSAVDTITGKPERAKDIIIEPIQGTAETAATAVEGTINTPIEGTTETFKEEAQQ